MKNLQCSGSYRIKGQHYLKIEDAVQACDVEESCFGLYDMSCYGNGFTLCSNETKWRKQGTYGEESETSCVHFKPLKSGIMFHFMGIPNV